MYLSLILERRVGEEGQPVGKEKGDSTVCLAFSFLSRHVCEEFVEEAKENNDIARAMQVKDRESFSIDSYSEWWRNESE